MKRKCRIVCPNACQNCDIMPCEDRMADEETEGKLHIAAAQAVAMSSTELQKFFDGSPSKGLGLHPYEDGAFSHASGSIAPSPYEDEISQPKVQEAMEKIKALDGLKHCGMRSDLSCRICHDDTCRVRMAKRTL